MSSVLSNAIQNYTATRAILEKRWNFRSATNDFVLKDNNSLKLLPPSKQVTKTIFSYLEAVELEIELARYEEILNRSMGFSPRPLDIEHFVDVMEMTNSLSSAVVAAHGGSNIQRFLDMPLRNVIIELARNKIRFQYVGE